MGVVPDGYYASRSVTELVRGATRSELEAILAALDQVRQGSLNAEQTAERVRSAGPAGNSIANWLAQQPNRIELWTFVAMLATVIAVLLAFRGDSSQGPRPQVNIEIEQRVEIEAPAPELPDVETLIQQAVEKWTGHTVFPPDETAPPSTP